MLASTSTKKGQIAKPRKRVNKNLFFPQNVKLFFLSLNTKPPLHATKSLVPLFLSFLFYSRQWKRREREIKMKKGRDGNIKTWK